MTTPPDEGFTGLTINPTITDGMWSDLVQMGLDPASDHGRIIRIGNLPAGMSSGRPALQVAIQLADGRIVTAETSWRLMRAALKAIEAAWPGWDD